jgi:hypothetical protein
MHVTYTESNYSFVNSILKPYFLAAGITVDQNTFDEIVDRICNDDSYKNLTAENSHDYIAQKGLNLLKELHG